MKEEKLVRRKIKTIKIEKEDELHDIENLMKQRSYKRRRGALRQIKN